MSALDGALAFVLWLSVGEVVYAYAGYPILLTLLARVRRRPLQRQPITPPVSLIIAAYNEEAVIAAKIENALALDYPRARLDILIAADGSTDRTCEIARAFASRGVRVLHEPPRRGKLAAMNRAAPFATGDILVFSDANAMMEPPALCALVASFADPRVACVGGEKRIRRAASLQAQGEGAYWRYEAYLKRLDSEVNTAIGAVGELFAIRRDLFQPLDTDLLIEDFVLTMRLAARGWRIVYEPRAVTWEEATPSLRGEWRRRVRTSAGGFQAMGRLPEMLDPRRGLVVWQYWSHKIARWVAPFFMLAAFGANLGLAQFDFYRVTLLAQSVFYALALFGYVLQRAGMRVGLFQMPFYFCFANATSLAGFVRFATRTQPVTWKKSR
ncbi:MAG: glycosyltransferase family 2 protein [Chloroflexi bacterium]|nr:glycosyltransferase family 2 protein [Chloroflexota bacterium]